MIDHLTAIELAQRLTQPDNGASRPLLLDVREPWETALGIIPGSVCIPMHDIPARQNELPDAQEIVCICHHGMRSMNVAHYLDQAGFSRLLNLTGGVDAWARQVDPSMGTY